MHIVRGTVFAAALVVSACASHPAKEERPQATPSTPAAPTPPPATAPAAVETHAEAAAPAHHAAAAAVAHHTGVRMPDPDLTPGKRSYRTLDQICEKGAAKDERNVSETEKKDVYASYGIAKCQGYCSGKQGCEIDHLISIELGGANTEDNLWPQPYDGEWSAHDKDRLENKLHSLVCAKTNPLSLREAQKAIATDWVAAYKKYVGEERKPFKAVAHCQ
jgi:hypothetical protein